MGGRGSGRFWRWDDKTTTDAFHSIDVRRWARRGLLEPGTSFGWQWSIEGKEVASIRASAERGRIILSYRSRSHGSDWENMRYAVTLLSQPCYLGGERLWFQCPAQGCTRRVAILYGGRVFACRHCHQLVYPSQRELPFQRASRRADKVRASIGWDQDEVCGLKPKHMHWRTFEKKVVEIERLENLAHYEIERRLNGWFSQ